MKRCRHRESMGLLQVKAICIARRMNAVTWCDFGGWLSFHFATRPAPGVWLRSVVPFFTFHDGLPLCHFLSMRFFLLVAGFDFALPGALPQKLAVPHPDRFISKKLRTAGHPHSDFWDSRSP